MRCAILVDGAFYRRRASKALGDKSPKDRADELIDYCWRHLKWHGQTAAELYRIYYYDCPPITKQVYHPYLQKTVDLSKTGLYKWSTDFYDELKKKRKVALRMGEISEVTARFEIKPDIVNKLLRRELSIDDLAESDFIYRGEQKGVDMKIGLDIASLAYKKQVEQIVLISGDSDFVSAAKLARREGIDFILDPLFAKIKPHLFEHIDGLRTCDARF